MIDYEIVGNEVQYLEVKLNQGKSASVESGYPIYRAPGTKIDTGSGGMREHFRTYLQDPQYFCLS